MNEEQKPMEVIKYIKFNTSGAKRKFIKLLNKCSDASEARIKVVDEFKVDQITAFHAVETFKEHINNQTL